MAVLEEAVHARLAATSGVTTLTGARIYNQVLPQNATLEAVTVQRISTTRESAMGADPGQAYARIQVCSWATLHGEARALAEAVRAALQRWRGTVASVEVEASFLLNEFDRYEDEREIHRVLQDYGIWYRE